LASDIVVKNVCQIEGTGKGLAVADVINFFVEIVPFQFPLAIETSIGCRIPLVAGIKNL